MIDKIKSLYKTCFNDSDKYIDYAFSEKFGLYNCLYQMDGDKVVSEMFIVPKKLSISSFTVDCPYICGVCTLPEYRRKGLADTLLKQSFAKLAESGYSICALHPFRHSFYQKFGFVTYNKIRQYQVQHNLCYKGSVITKITTENDCDVLLKLYNNFMIRYNGYVYRDLAEMQRRYRDLTSDGACEIVYVDDQPYGYLFYDDDKFIAEYCGDKNILQALEKFDGYTVNLPLCSSIGQPMDFTMVKILDKDKLLSQLNLINHKDFLTKLSDDELVHLLFGSYQDFNIEINQDIKAKYPKKTNYVFDKY